MASETTAQELLDSGIRPQRATERLRSEVMRRLQAAQNGGGKPRIDALRSLLPSVVMEDGALESLVASLLSGGHVLVLGPPGSGKTTLAKAVWDLMPRDLFAVADCPLQCDPMSLVDPAFSRAVPPCPFCLHSHGKGMHSGAFDAKALRAKDVPVKRTVLREGHGFARIQGSAEVFPDNLTGSVNLARLEELGDPTSPLVLEPGKVLQAHRGFLLVDEVGKMPRGTQNVLLQALQEGSVTPAKTRETFPADIVAVATSNLRDVGAITEPLSDRLSSVHHGLPTTASANRRVVDLGLGAADGAMPVPGPYRDAAVRLMMLWRARVEGGDDLAEVGSNRTLVEMLRRARAYAMLEGASQIDPEDLHRGARDAMLGRVRARTPEGFDENRRTVASFVQTHWKSAARDGAVDYWCRFYVGELKEDKAEAARTLQEVRNALAASDKTRLQGMLRAQGGEPRVRRFAQFVQDEEKSDREGAAEALPAVVKALDQLGAFEEKAKVDVKA
jgi:MoxR-like ATPase